jgi:hypothetical protein
MEKIEWGNVFIAVLGILVTVGVVNWFLNSLFHVPMLKIGNIILIYLGVIIVGAVLTRIVITNKFAFERKDLLATIVAVVLVVALIIFAPKIVPGWFEPGTLFSALGNLNAMVMP